MTASSAAVLSIGTFDGVHVGHQTLIARARDAARRHQGALVAMTFDPPPRAVLRPETPIEELTPGGEKARWLQQYGADEVAVLPFTPAFAQLDAMEFLETVVWDHYRPAVLVEGYDFTFGRMAKGNVEVLREWAEGRGIEVEVVAPVALGEIVVSSSGIRALVREGQLLEAERRLGHPYGARGPVEEGDARGRTLGFPTANVALSPTKLMPPYGIYAGMATLPSGERHPAVASWGKRPMFQADRPLLEVHLIDYHGDLYGQTLWFEFRAYLRAEARFRDVGELIGAMAEDVVRARAVLAGG